MGYDFELPISENYFLQPGARLAFERWVKQMQHGQPKRGEFLQFGIRAELPQNPNRVFEINERATAVVYQDVIEKDGVTYLRGTYLETPGGKQAKAFPDDYRLSYRMVVDDAGVVELITFDVVYKEPLDNVPTDEQYETWG